MLKKNSKNDQIWSSDQNDVSSIITLLIGKLLFLFYRYYYSVMSFKQFELLRKVHVYSFRNFHPTMSAGNTRANIKIGSNVGIVLKNDQRSGKITQGVVKRILTKSSTHPHGIKVQLEDGQVGRVKEIRS